ncbi:nucleotidyltransferase family protein [Escherichia coli]
MKPSLELEKHREAIRELVHKYGLHNPRIFGSVAKGTDTEASDLDLLVDAGKKTSLFDMGGLYEELSALLSCPVHVLTPNEIRTDIRAKVLFYAIPL